MKNTILILLFLSLIGCAPTQQVIKPLVEPQFGMTKQEMLDALGKPQETEIYKKLDDTRYEFDIYVRQYATSTYRLPICLVNGKVVGWGKNYYDDHISSNDTRIK